MAGNTQTISANGNGSWIRLARGLNLVTFHSGTWSTTAIGLEHADNIAGDRPNTVFIDGSAFSAASATEKSIVLYGDGDSAVRPVTTNYGSTPVTMKVTVVAPSTAEGL